MGVHCFGEFRLDGDSRQLLRGGKALHLSPKAFQLLQALVEACPRALSKAKLQDRLWPDTFVIEANLQHLVSEIRKALEDDPQHPRYLRTLHGFGYALQGLEIPSEPSRPSAVCRLNWDGGRVTLEEGDYTVGRDATADIVLNFPSVSRRHARIRLTGRGIMLEDLGSKNGTFIGDEHVDRTATLVDGSCVRFGSILVTVRISTAPTTETTIDSRR